MSSDAPSPVFDVNAVADAMKALSVAKSVRDAFLEAAEDAATLSLPDLNRILKDAGVADPEARATIRKAALLASEVGRVVRAAHYLHGVSSCALFPPAACRSTRGCPCSSSRRSCYGTPCERVCVPRDAWEWNALVAGSVAIGA